MEDRVYLMLRLRIKTTHTRIAKAINELEKFTKLEIPDTANVQVLKTEVVRTHRKMV